MAAERGEVSNGHGAKAPAKGHGFLGSLKDALLAAGREDSPIAAKEAASSDGPAKKIEVIALPPPAPAAAISTVETVEEIPAQSPSAAEAARLARAGIAKSVRLIATPSEPEQPPTTRVVRDRAAAPVQADAPRTQLVRGRQPIERGSFERDPVVGFLVVVGGPGLGAFRPVYEGNNTVGRAASNRIALDFGDDAISADSQAYIRYDGDNRSFLFVPNLAKTNIVSVNETRPTGAVPLKAMDVITLGRTQVAFVPFCGEEFDWSEIAGS